MVLSEELTKAELHSVMAHAEAWTDSAPGAGISRDAFTRLIQQFHD